MGGLEILAGLIQEVSQYTNELHDALNRQPIISAATYLVLDDVLMRLDSIYGTLNKQLMRLDGDNVDRIEPTYLQVQHNTVVAHGKFVAFLLDNVAL